MFSGPASRCGQSPDSRALRGDSGRRAERTEARTSGMRKEARATAKALARLSDRPLCKGHQLLLRKVFSVQSGDERGVPLFCTGTKCVIGRIWRYVIFAPNVHELRRLPEQIDDSPNEVSSNPES